MTTTVRTVSEAMRHVRRFEAVTAEGVGGTLEVDNVLVYWRCRYMRPGSPWNEVWFRDEDTAAVHDLLRAWWPRLCLPGRSGLNRRGKGKVLPKSLTRRGRKGIDPKNDYSGCTRPGDEGPEQLEGFDCHAGFAPG